MQASSISLKAQEKCCLQEKKLIIIYKYIK